MSGMSNPEADPLPGEGLGDHSRAQAVFLTGVHPRKTEGTDIRASISADQIVAKEFGKETELTSLELGLEAVDLVGGCEDGYACAYSGAIGVAQRDHAAAGAGAAARGVRAAVRRQRQHRPRRAG